MAASGHPTYRAALAVLLLGGTAALWSRLPESMPVHWNVHGRVDRMGGRLEGALIAPIVFVVIWVAATWLPRLDPRQANVAKMRGAYDVVISATLTLMVVLQGVLLASALGLAVPVNRVVPAAVGLLLLVMGNVLPRARPNWWFGIRTPWTLSSDRVWARTHRVGGYAMAAGGLLMLATAVAPPAWVVPLFVAAIVLAALVPIAYSYRAWRQEHGA
ncbi:MAG TPA: SdpI family protein [Gemmatimonadaceae bacterium]|nr:SdpI family protein [Gemmatimonadaceae bacterium]